MTSTRLVAWSFGIVASAALTIACAGDGHLANRPQMTRKAAANDFSCAKEQTSIKPLGGASYEARGCGKHAYYECDARAEELVYWDELWTMHCKRSGDVQRD